MSTENDKITSSENDIMSSKDDIIFSENNNMSNENDTWLNSTHSSEQILVSMMDKVIIYAK